MRRKNRKSLQQTVVQVFFSINTRIIPDEGPMQATLITKNLVSLPPAVGKWAVEAPDDPKSLFRSAVWMLFESMVLSLGWWLQLYLRSLFSRLDRTLFSLKREVRLAVKDLAQLTDIITASIDSRFFDEITGLLKATWWLLVDISRGAPVSSVMLSIGLKSMLYGLGVSA